MSVKKRAPLKVALTLVAGLAATGCAGTSPYFNQQAQASNNDIIWANPGAQQQGTVTYNNAPRQQHYASLLGSFPRKNGSVHSYYSDGTYAVNGRTIRRYNLNDYNERQAFNRSMETSAGYSVGDANTAIARGQRCLNNLNRPINIGSILFPGQYSACRF